MSRLTHGLIALLAVAALVALVVGWWPPAHSPTHPVTVPTPGPSTTATTATSTTTTTAPVTPRGTQTIFPGATLTPCPRKGREVPLTVVTFNIHSAVGRAGLRLEQIAGEIAAVEPDVVLLQEVDKDRFRSNFLDEAEVLASLLDMRHVFASNVERIGLRTGDPVSEYGTAVLTRLKVENWTHTLLPNLAGLQQRGLQHLVLRLAGRPISVYNAHLDHTMPALRQEQMRLARDIVGLDHYPALFGGDFNGSPDSHPAAGARPATHRPVRPVAARRRG